MKTIHLMNYISPICYTALAIGAIAILIKRAQKRIVTFKEISDWATSECNAGEICTLCILSTMPNDVRKAVRKSNGLTQILNGYREETSIFVTVTDSNDEIIRTYFFMSKSLDRELSQAFSNSNILRLTL